MAMASAARPLHSSHGDPFLLLHRAHMLIYACFLLLHFLLHLLRLLSSPSLPFLTLFLSDLVLAIQWALFQAFRWNPVHRRDHPEQLAAGLPRLDVFVCTADPRKEPPMGVANTVLSVLGFEYPAEKLSVYVSDDGGSEMTLYAFVEAARFARSWLPFCRENRVVDRSPEKLFGLGICPPGYEEMKKLYEEMKDRVDKAMDRGFLDDDELLKVEKAGFLETFRKWAAPGFEPTDHPAIVEVLLDLNRDRDTRGSPLPNLIYMSREKNRACPHHFKAGALNSLLRVSGSMSNAPVVLTLDCDTVSNDPSAPRHALCYLLDEEINSNLAFVQFPQRFAGLNRDDTYGETFLGLFHANPLGMDALGGPNYVGSCTFFARRALHNAAAPPVDAQVIASHEAVKRARYACSCASERGTEWGTTVGFRYGSLVEDYYTGLVLHSQGWRSVYCNPERAAFLGEAPLALHDSLCQVRRWTVGLLEVALSRHCPLLLGFRNRGFLLLSFCYAHYSFWPFWSFPILTYAILPPLALLCNRPIFPKVDDRSATMIYWYLFLAAYAKDLLDFLRAGGTHSRWWNDQRMWMIRGITSFPAGCIDYLRHHLGFPGHGFTVTSKVAADGDRSVRYRNGLFELGPTTPFVVSIGTAATLSLAALVVGCWRSTRDSGDAMVLELLLVGFVVANCLPIYEGMVARKDGGRMRLDCVVICLLLAGFLVLAGRYIFPQLVFD